MQDIFEPIHPQHILAASRDIQAIRNEIVRLNLQLKKLRDKKRPIEAIVYAYMQEKNLAKVFDIKVASVRPKNMLKRKPMSQKKQDAIDLFRSEGLMDPESFWDRFQSTQKVVAGGEERVI